MSTQLKKRWAHSLLRSGRQFVLVDIENLAAGACITDTAVRSAKAALVATGQIRSADHVVIGTSHIGLMQVGSVWSGVRYVVRSGPDGADMALLDVMAEDVADRFESVVLASGDGIFTDAVAALAAAGVPTVVIGRRGHVARSLQIVATNVIYLDSAPEPRAAA